MNLDRLSSKEGSGHIAEYVPEALREKTAKFEQFLCSMIASPLTAAGRKPSIAAAAETNAYMRKDMGYKTDKNGITRGEWSLTLPHLGKLTIRNITDNDRLARNATENRYSWHVDLVFENGQSFKDLPFEARTLEMSLIQDGEFPTGLSYKIYGKGQWESYGPEEEELADRAGATWEGEYAGMHYSSKRAEIGSEDMQRLNELLDYVEKVVKPAANREHESFTKQQQQLAGLAPATVHEMLASLIREGGAPMREKINSILSRPAE